jgi:hypothetical protein
MATPGGSNRRKKEKAEKAGNRVAIPDGSKRTRSSSIGQNRGDAFFGRPASEQNGTLKSEIGHLH